MLCNQSIPVKSSVGFTRQLFIVICTHFGENVASFEHGGPNVHWRFCMYYLKFKSQLQSSYKAGGSFKTQWLSYTFKLLLLGPEVDEWHNELAHHETVKRHVVDGDHMQMLLLFFLPPSSLGARPASGQQRRGLVQCTQQRQHAAVSGYVTCWLTSLSSLTGLCQ